MHAAVHAAVGPAVHAAVGPAVAAAIAPLAAQIGAMYVVLYFDPLVYHTKYLCFEQE